MDDVGLEVLEVGGDPVGELLDVVLEILLGQIGRAGRHVDHVEPGLDRHPLGEIVGPAPHVDPADDAGLGQRRDELPHVDVHAPTVADAGLGQRRGVQREDGCPSYHRGQL